MLTPPVTTFNISGFKIYDNNNNGIWDAGEHGIAGWNITIKNSTTDAEIATSTTDAIGFYQLTNLAPGDYNVTEETRAGWSPTNATFKVITLNNDIMNLNFTNHQAPIQGRGAGGGGAPPAIVNFAPPSPAIDTPVATRQFNITVNQTVNVTWYINGTQVQVNNSITDAKYTNTSASIGIWNVSAGAINDNGSDIQTWTWTVSNMAIVSEITSTYPTPPDKTTQH
ncbi:MAG: SpaA isopeptide-forming pilin-related protein [Candidatus Methanoperedens sp.]|nr:SpaA isopeptide-forming pilin-related protein [Candidatus Methanoperedens sp.]